MTAESGAATRTLPFEVVPDRSPSPTFLHPLSDPHRGQTSHDGASHFSTSLSAPLRDQFIDAFRHFLRKSAKINQEMSAFQRGFLLLLVSIGFVLVVLFLVYNDRLFESLHTFAMGWQNIRGGWTILWGLIFLTAFPPIVGYSTCGALAGLVYGIGKGWLILSSATVVGSTCSLLVSRFLLHRYTERLVTRDKRFAALTLTLKHDGLKLLCMIRLCPLPYSLSNGAVSTIPTVQAKMYALATAIVSPKLLINVFIGSRLSAIGENGGASFGTKAVNLISIFLTGLVGLCTAWYIYQRTMARARHLEMEEESNVHSSVAITGAPPTEFLDDPEAYAAAVTLAENDDDLPYLEDNEEAGPDQYRDEEIDDLNASP